MADITLLKNIIDIKFVTEVDDVLTKIEAIGTTTTIEALSQLQPSTLGPVIRGFVGSTFYDDLYDTTIEKGDDSAAAEITLKDHIIGDINNPSTTLEQQRVDTVWDYFLNLYEGKRQGLMEFMSSSFRQNVAFTATKNPFDLFASQSQSIFERDLTDEFYVVYADYLIFEAQRYLRVKRSTYMAIGRVLEQTSNKPIANAKITTLPTAGLSFGGETRSNFDGYYNLYFSSLEELTGTVGLKVGIENIGYNPKAPTLNFKTDEPKIVLVTKLVPQNDDTSAVITTVASTLSFSIPPFLSTFFGSTIVTFADIRSAGLLVNQTDENLDKSNDVLKRLDALAVMELISSSYEKNNLIYNDGLGPRNFMDVASIPRGKFIEDNSSILDGDYNAIKYYEIASRQAMTAVNEMNPVKDGLNTTPVDPELETYEECGCGDCNSAVGPMAYLADLLSFSTEKLTDDAVAVDTAWLLGNLYRDFGAIPIDCSELEDNVCQARIATEVLEGNYSALTNVPGNISNLLLVRRREYLIETYKTILINIGTTYEELQSYQSILDPEERKRYANRLGIVLEYPGNSVETIKLMYKDVALNSAVSASYLQSYFGLANTNSTDAAPESKFEKWKAERLKEVWAERDHVNTIFSRGEKVIIDPDCVTVDDFRLPKSDRYIGFKIWTNRTTFVSDNYDLLKGKLTVAVQAAEMNTGTFSYTPDSGSPVNLTIVWPPNSLALISTLVVEVSKGSTAASETLWNDFRLKSTEASKLIELDLKETNEAGEVTPGEKNEAVNILLKVLKRKFEPTWLTEENAEGIILSNQDFWLSEKAPVVGSWPPVLEAGEPLIDPERITLEGLTERTYQVMNFAEALRPTAIYHARKSELELIASNDLDGLNNLPALVDFAFEASTPQYTYNGTIPNFEELYASLNNPATTNVAITKINDELKLSVDEFVFIMGLGAKYGIAPAVFTLAEKERLYSILVKSRKVFSKYPTWVTQEGSTPFWKTRKAKLPLWRTSVQERNEWVNAFHEHNKSPIIDGDLIGPAYMVSPIVGNGAFDLWLSRYNEMNNAGGWYLSIAAKTPFATSKNEANFDLLVQYYLMQNSGVTLEEIILRKEAKEDINPVLEQLNISSSNFNFLVQLRDSLGGANTLSENQLEKLYYTLAETQKVRQFYKYRIQEIAADVTQSPEFFVSRDTDYYTYPPTVPYPLNTYLVSEQELSSWRRIVSSRKDESISAEQSYATLLLEVDDETLPFVRDALVEAIYDFNTIGTDPLVSRNISLPEKARKLGDRLLIDLQDNCCSKTNRVAQAIETMQQLIWKTNTSDILSDYPDMVLNVDSFDTIWEWLGSYANWRASMFVYLYPENILLPSLKKESTAGFRTILENTQNNRNFNPSMACEVSNDYREYLKDVSTLKLKYSAQSRVVTSKVDKCAGFDQIIENLTFVFATAENSGKTYYMTVKSTEENDSQKTSWQRVPNLPDDAILKGADAYLNTSLGINYVYLFFIISSADGLQEFHSIRFDANLNVWESEFDTYKVDIGELYNTTSNWYELAGEVPEDFELLSLEVCHNGFYWMPPHLSISMRIDISSFATFSRSIDWDGVKLKGEELWNMWKRFQFPGNDGIGFAMNAAPVKKVVFKYTPVASTKPYYYGFEYYFIDQHNNVFKHYLGSNGETKWEMVSNYSYDGGFAWDFSQKDMFTLNQSDAVFRLDFEEQNGSSQVENNAWQVARSFDADNDVFQSFFLNQDFDYSIANQGLSSASLLRPFIYQQKNSHSQIFFTSIAYNENPSDSEDWTFIFGETKIPLNPVFGSTPAFDPDLDRSELDSLKTKSEANLTANTLTDNPKLRLYSDEAYYYAPIEIALRLRDNGYYTEALRWFRMVYDYFAPEGDRKIYYGLIEEESFENLQDRLAEWYTDPLNPHLIASTRENAFTRFTMMSIANTLLAYANAEFTTDNSETVPRSREMYEDIIDLLSVLEIKDPCARDESIRSLESFIDNDLIWKYAWQKVFKNLEDLQIDPDKFSALVDDIKTELDSSVFPETKYANVEMLISTAKAGIPTTTINSRLTDYKENVNKRIGLTLAGGDLEGIYRTGQGASARNVLNNLSAVTGFDQSELETANLSWLYDGSAATQSDKFDTNPVALTQSRAIHEFSRVQPIEGYNLANPFPEIRLSGMPYLFCVNPNPMVAASLMMAYANLYKIHNCMNIAGMVRELNPFAAPTDATSGMPSIGVGGTLQMPGQASIAPTNYRYAFLVERARQLVSFAQQMEGTLLQSLEKFDAESYSQLQAEQDLDLAKANIKLQDLRVKEAESGKVLAELQKERAEIQVSGLQGMIDEGLLSSELALINNFNYISLLQQDLALSESALQTTNALLNTVSAGGGTTAGLSIFAAMVQFAVVSTISSNIARTRSSLSSVQAASSINSLFASLQRRQQEWEFQKTIANQDVKIGGQQIKIADGRIRVVSQEREIADLQQEQAQATLDFLKTKFTNAELYEWMSGILEDVYSYFLQEATAMSKLAEQQLAFERQFNLPNLIKSDYWNINANNSLSLSGGEGADRKGLTGSARLLRDLTELEIYAQDSNQRKLQITKVMSLNEHDPVEMERFRSEGVLRFATTHRDFDWDHPGQYLRTIRRVSVTVIALTPPTDGIKATFINNGISSVITSNNNLFQTKVIARTPERIVLSSPYNDYGIFQLETNDSMYRPFEGSGVETLWELRMEKAANPFDYRSIADVLLTIEYDSLHSEQYGQITRAQLNQEDRMGSLVFSLRNDLPDQWYELMNADGTGLTSSFEIRNSDLAPNVLSNMLTKVKVFASFDRDKMTIDNSDDTDSIVGSFIVSKGVEITNDSDIGASVELNQLLLSSLYDFEGFPGIEQTIQGEWYMRFTETTDVLKMIDKGHLRDIIIIIEYSADRVPFITNDNA